MNKGLTMLDYSPEKAGVGGSTPSLTTTIFAVTELSSRGGRVEGRQSMRRGNERLAKLSAVILIHLAVLTPSAICKDNQAEGKGAAAFKGNCVSCHGSDGAGTTLGKTMQAPDLRSDEVQKKPDADLAKVIGEGKNNMPAFHNTFNPQQIQDLVAYVRQLGKQASQK
jgi:mono/diheme cytochrome c family protein